MAAGEYLSSKSQREISLAQIAEEREKVAERPAMYRSSLRTSSRRTACPRRGLWRREMIGRHRDVLLNTKVLRQYGVASRRPAGSPLQGPS